MPMEFAGLCPLLQVFDMPTAVRFYRDIFGFEIVSRSPTYAIENGEELFHWVLLKHNFTELMLNTAYDEGERPECPDAARVEAHLDTGLFIGCRDLDGAYAHLQKHGVACHPPRTAHYGMRQLSLRDPDGYGITLQWPVEPDTLVS